MNEKILELENMIKALQQEVAELKRAKNKKYGNNVTDTEIILTDTLNDEDKYKICIMSSNIIVERVGD